MSDATRAMVVDVDATSRSGLAAPIAPRRRVMWLVAVGRGAALLLITVAVSVLMGRNSDSVGLAHARRYPARMVAVTYDGRLLLVSSRDGHAVRTIASDAFAGGGVAVSPDGATVYYARATGGRCPNGDPVTEIVSVSITGTVAKPIAANVHYPEVSPDGRHLAFTGLPGCSDAGSAVLMLDLRAPSAAPRPFARKWDSEANPASSFGISNLAWAPDSRHLLVVWRATALGIHVLDTRSQASLDGSPRLELRNTNRRWNTICCYLSNNKFVGSSVRRDRSTVWTFDATGARRNRLTCCGTVLSIDRVDHALLINFTDPKHVGGIYRWSVGDHRPTYLGSLFHTATWVS